MFEPTTVEVNGQSYRIGRLNAFKQLHIVKRLAPGLAHMSKSVNALLRTIVPNLKELPETDNDELMEDIAPILAEAFAKLSDEDVDYVVTVCTRVCHRKQATGWAPVMDVNGNLMMDDLSAIDLVRLSTEVIKENLGGFFTGKAPLTATVAQPIPAV